MPLLRVGCQCADKLWLYIRLITVIRAMSVAIAGQRISRLFVRLRLTETN